MSSRADGLRGSAPRAAHRAKGLSTGVNRVDEELREHCLIAEDRLFNPFYHYVILRYVILERVSRQGNLQALSSVCAAENTRRTNLTNRMA